METGLKLKLQKSYLQAEAQTFQLFMQTGSFID